MNLDTGISVFGTLSSLADDVITKPAMSYRETAPSPNVESGDQPIPELLGPAQSVVASINAEWLTSPRFALLLLLLIMAMFPDVIFGAKTFFFRDYAMFGYPLAHYNREAFWHGEIPLWNPLNNCGIPYLAQWNTMVLYPFSLIYLVLPMPWSLGWFCLLHVFLGGLGMYYLAYRWSGTRLGASVAGIAFAFNGSTLAFLIWPSSIAALGWLPWVWLCVERGCNRGGRAALAATAVGAIQMLSGAPEVILFTWISVAALCVWNVCVRDQSRWKLVIRFLAICVAVGALAAVQLLPFLDLLRHSDRPVQAANTAWSMPLWGWANFFVPLFRGTRTSLGVYMQPGQAWISSYYLGLGPLLLAVAAVWTNRQRAVLLLGIGAVLGVILAMGDAGLLYLLLRKICPAIGLMRYPVKFVIVSASLVPLLAAFAVGRWQQVRIDRRMPSWRMAGFATMICLAIIAGILIFAFLGPGTDEQPRATLMNGLTRGGVLLLTLGAWCALEKWSDRSSKTTAFLQLAFLVALWLDLISHVPKQNPTVAAAAYDAKLPPLQEMQPLPKPGASRALLSWAAKAKFQNYMTPDPVDCILASRLGLFCNCNLPAGIPKVDGFFPLYLAEEKKLHFAIYSDTNTIRSPIADFVGISQIVLPSLDWEPRHTWMPMITSGQRPQFVEGEQALERLLRPDFDPRATVYLPLEARPKISASNGAPARIISQSVSAHRIGVDAEADGQSLLVIAQTYYHCWKARVDGQPTTLWRANHAFQALEVPPGRHKVELVYEDGTFRCGAIISGATLLLCGAFFIRCRRSHQMVPKS